MNIKTKLFRILLRFAKAFTSGFFSGAALVTIANVNSWMDLQHTAGAIGFSAIIGGINGVIMAGEKWFSWKNVDELTPPTPDEKLGVEVDY